MSKKEIEQVVGFLETHLALFKSGLDPSTDKIAKQIDALYHPEPSSKLLLTEEEIEQCWQDCYDEPLPETRGLLFGRTVRSRQLAKCQEHYEVLDEKERIKEIRADQEAETRREIGEWLWRIVMEAGLSADLFAAIEKLKSGQSPKEV